MCLDNNNKNKKKISRDTLLINLSNDCPSREKIQKEKIQNKY